MELDKFPDFGIFKIDDATNYRTLRRHWGRFLKSEKEGLQSCRYQWASDSFMQVQVVRYMQILKRFENALYLILQL
jgi:hypothetical protein